MHIAVCDDNIADRKQMERLLGRESDRRYQENGEGFYTDCYGSIPAMLSCAQLYDAIFIDMVSSEKNGLEVARDILASGYNKTLVLCSSSLRYEGMADTDHDCYQYMDKPILKAKLRTMLDYAISVAASADPMIEVRTHTDTIYISGKDIIYAKSIGGETEITMIGGRKLQCLQDLYNFYEECSHFPQLCPINDNNVVNIHHIKQHGFMSVTMDDGTKLKVGIGFNKNIGLAKDLVEQKNTHL